MVNCVFNKGKQCAVLNQKNCEKCSFYKTPRELHVGREKANERLESLPKEQYQAIMKKYYDRNIAEVE